MKIAYITERNLTSNQLSGAITKDLRLLKILQSFSSVQVYFNDTTIFHKYYYLLNNGNINEKLFSEINENAYDLIIISAMVISPYLEGYRKIKGKKIFYFADSQFHEKNQKLSLKYTLLTTILANKEKSILKNNLCAYLGEDEIKYIPKRYQQNCLVFPFAIDLNQYSFQNDGKLILVGQFSYLPNYQMLVNINKIADKIHSKIYIYGQNIPDLDYKENMIVVGYADQLDDVYKDARALLYTIDYGVGIKNKVLEAMSYGVPTIGYKEAFTNLELENGKSCIEINDEKALIDAANNLDLSEISKQAYHTTEKKYSTEHITEIIKKSISQAIEN